VTDTKYDVDFNFDNSYAKQLDGFYTPFIGDAAPNPKLIKFNKSLANKLGLDFSCLASKDIAAILSGGVSLKGGAPLAQVYAGHQFGGFSPRLGDGRALLLGEVIDPDGNRHDIHLKGSGRTTYSRGGDGKAALAPVLREYLLGEAMHALGVPTTRALAAVATGENVYRDALLPGAVLARTASSHIRVGTFQYFAAQGDYEKVKQLADYTIERHFLDLKVSQKPYLGLLRMVCDRQALLLAKWMQIGFVHGVMNTDNMTISGETIDYGPCAFIDHYDASAVFSSIDHQGRYAFENQMPMAQWNLARLAETLLPFIDENSDESVKLAMEEIRIFSETYQQLWLEGMCKKIGLTNVLAGDLTIIEQLLKLMQTEKVDFTLMFRALSGALYEGEGEGGFEALRIQFNASSDFDEWLILWQQRALKEPSDPEARAALMNSVNPLYIPRNHLVEAALQAAEQDSNFEPFEKLMTVLEKPFDKRQGFEEYAKPAPLEFGQYKTFCGT
jgi:uncharacterized protein YdiU (UPF0061 family)